MSDTPNPGNLASASEFDARLKGTDENRWLATRYAPAAKRERLVAIYLLYQELQRALQVSEPMLGKIRIQWWRETLEQVAGRGQLRRHDLAEELARVTADRTDLIGPLNELIDQVDDIVDDHLRAGGHETGEKHTQRHLAAEASLARLAGSSLDPQVKRDELDALACCGEAYLAIMGRLADADARWEAARKAARRLRPQLWPAIGHLAAAREPYRLADNPRTARRAPLLKRWRVLSAMFSRRL